MNKNNNVGIMKKVFIIIFTASFVGNCVSNDVNQFEDPIYEWRKIGLFNGQDIIHMDYSDEGALVVSTNKKIYVSYDDAEYFTVSYTPYSVDSYKVRIQNGNYYLVSDIYDSEHGTPWTGKTKMLYYKKDINSDWEYITGRYQLFDAVKQADKLYIGVLNGVITLDLSTNERNKVEFFRSRLSDLIDDMLLFDDYVLASSHEGVFGSNNGGESWQDLTKQFSKEYDHIFNMELDEKRQLHAISESRVYVVTDNNFNWEIRYLNDDFEDISIIDSNTYVGIEKRSVKLLVMNNKNRAKDYDITPLQVLANEEREFKNIRVSNNGAIFLATEDGFYVGNPNRESSYWN